MKWKRSRKAKEQVEAGRGRKPANENPASGTQGAGLGEQDAEEDEEVDDEENGFRGDAEHSDFLRKHADVRNASDDDLEEARGGEGKMGAGL